PSRAGEGVMVQAALSAARPSGAGFPCGKGWVMGVFSVRRPVARIEQLDASFGPPGGKLPEIRVLPVKSDAAPGVRRGLRRASRIACGIAGSLVAGLIGTAAITGAAAQTPVKFSLDNRFEGPSAPFLVGIDRGFYRDEGLNVAIDSAAGSRDAIARVASGRYDLGFGDINALIKFRDQNPGAPVRAVFMVYNRPAFSIVTRRSRGVTSPRDLEGKKLGAPAADSAFAQWKIFVHANGIDASKVAIENVGTPIREPMLAAG